MPTPFESLYNYSENKTRLRSQSLSASLSSWTHDACEWEKSLVLSSSPKETDCSRPSILDWRHANTTRHLNRNDVSEDGRIPTVGLAEEISFPGLSHTRHHAPVMPGCNIANNSTNEDAKAMTYIVRANHHEYTKELKAKKG